MDTVGLERHFLLQKQPQLQPYTFLEVFKGEVSQFRLQATEATSFSKTQRIRFCRFKCRFRSSPQPRATDICI